MCCHPAFGFALGEKHAVKAFLGTGAGVEIKSEHLMKTLKPVVNHYLPAFEMSMPEGWCDIND